MKNFNVRKESRTSRDCFRIATTSLELAMRSKENWEVEHHSITGTIFVAFSIEAMLNHFGRILFDDWNDQKGTRKDLHKKIFVAVNLPEYLGSKTYKKAKSCFNLRDELAHGKTREETLEVTLPDDTSRENTVRHMTSIATKPVRKISIQLLDEYILVAKKIEKDIQENGYYPNQEHLSLELREKLIECPLDVTGICIWQNIISR